jgi:hypothetical protein
MGVLSGKQAPLRDQAVMAGNVKAQADLWPDRGRGPALSLPQEMCGYSHKELAAVCPDSRFWYLPGEANVPAMLKNSVSFPHARVSLALLALARNRWYPTRGSVGMVDAQKQVCASVLSRPISARFLQAHGPLR